MEPSVIRDTGIFVGLYLMGLVGVGVLVAVVRDRSPSSHLVEVWTDPVWLFVVLLGIGIWLAMYPRIRRSREEAIR